MFFQFLWKVLYHNENKNISGEDMESKTIISVLLVIIALLLVGGIMIVLPQSNELIQSQITLNSNDTLHDGEYISISLTDAKGNPLANQVVYITIVDEKGTKNLQKVKTDGMGNGMLQLNGMASGKYTVNITYSGNRNTSGTNLTKTIEIKEIQKQTKSSESSSSRFSDAQWSKRSYWDDGTPTKGEVYLITTKDGDVWTYDNGNYYHYAN
jgi:hypothetical protein